MPLRHPLPGEKTITIIRRHWIIFLVNILWHLILLLAPVPLVWFLRGYFAEVFQNEIIFPIIVIILSIYYLMIWLFSYISFIDLYLDVWIITNKRVVNIEQLGIFSRIESEHRIDKIQDITTEVHGIGATLFNFGDLHVQTAGESQRFIFKQVPQPYYLKKTITALAEQLRQPNIQK